MSNGYFQNPCRKRITTRQTDLDGGDFSLSVVAAPGGDPGTFDVTATLKPKVNFGDVSGFVTAGNASLYDALDTETPIGTALGPNTTGVPGALSIVFPGVAQSVSNVGNTWLMVLANVEITAKDGQTFTIPSLSKTFPSPL
ncbi:MAG: hypothetical protein JNJ90_15640 [Saprospiraceae bacterium]|nr:hypothetical protein [Saprospiraceae bacterium]